VRLTRAIWALLAIALVVAGTATWWLTRPHAPEPPWVGAVSVLAGDGRLGWRDGPRDRARFSEPFGVAVHPNGAVYVTDAGTSHRIRRIAPDGAVTTVAGGGRGFADGRGAEARFATPSALAVAPDGSLVVADTGNHAIRRVTADGAVTTIAGGGSSGYVDGPAGRARFSGPIGVAVAPSGRIVVADTYNDRIRAIDPDGQVRTLAGGDGAALATSALGPVPSTAGYVDGKALDARFDTPCGVAIDAQGRVLVADSGNGLIRIIAADGVVSTLNVPAGTLERPMGLTVDVGGDLIVADESGRMMVLTPRGESRLLAGGSAGFADGVAGDAQFRRPSSVAVAFRDPREASATPQFVVADAGNAMVRLVRAAMPDPSGTSGRRPYQWPWTALDLPVPAAPVAQPAFDAEAFARVPLLWPVAPLDGPHEIAGTFGEARGEAGHERFHAGLDVREVQGTPVRAVRDGIVSSPFATFAFGTINEALRIGDLTYVHIRVGRMQRGPGYRVPGSGVRTATGNRQSATGASKAEVGTTKADTDLQGFAPVHDATGTMVRMRAMRGAFFSTGDVVGSVNAFNHVHLNVGWAGEEHDPLRFRLVQFRDGIPPTIAAGGVRVFDEAWQPLNPDRLGPPRGRGRARRPTRLAPLEPVIVRGRIRIVVDAWDQADGNKAYRRLGLSGVGYQVLDSAGVAMPGFETARETIRFDRLRRNADAPRQVYATGSGIPVYGANRTQFLYVVTTGYRDGVATPGFWDTTTVAPGEYVLRVFARDFSGNRTTRDLRVVVVS
jgi:sugar lactone lactonase YvrE